MLLASTKLAEGAYSLAMGWNGDLRQAYVRIADAGGNPEDWVWVLGSPATELWMDNYCIAAGAPNPEAAHAWINWELVPEISIKDLSYHGYHTGMKKMDQLLKELARIGQMAGQRPQVALRGQHALDPADLGRLDRSPAQGGVAVKQRCNLPLALLGLLFGLVVALVLAVVMHLLPGLGRSVLPFALISQTMPLPALTPLIVVPVGAMVFRERVRLKPLAWGLVSLVALALVLFNAPATGEFSWNGIAWNTNVIKDSEGPQTWEALADPKYKGKLFWASGSASGARTACTAAAARARRIDTASSCTDSA